MVSEQRETVQRIDADTLDIASNVSGAQRELLKYYASISSNRMLMLKIFGVIIVFVSRPPKNSRHDADLFLVPRIHPSLGLRTQWPGATAYLLLSTFLLLRRLDMSGTLMGHYNTLSLSNWYRIHTGSPLLPS